MIEVYWVSGIYICKAREAEIEACFDCPIDFHFTPDPEDLRDLIESFKEKKMKVKERLTRQTIM